jgi:membrane-bound metal-dependent hydrolase YbcI (DUF457 family)
MEWVSHTTTGFFIGQVMLKEEKRPKWAGAWWAIASISPDWLEWGTRWFGDIHRGVTHSLYVWPFLALAWAAAARTWGRHETHEVASIGKLWVIFFVVVGSHFLLDAMMNYRYYPAWPFSEDSWNLGVMPLFDIYIVIGWLGLWWFHRRLQLSSAVTARIGLAIFLVMFSVRSVGKIRAHTLAAEGPLIASASDIVTRPTYYTPWIWFVRDGRGESEWTPLNIVTGEVLTDYVRGRGFPPIPGRELVKQQTK